MNTDPHVGRERSIILDADSTEGATGTVMVPDARFLTDAAFLRQGDDLVLLMPDGATAVVRGYYALADPPTLMSPEGGTLTPALVASFAAASAAAESSAAGTTAQTVAGDIQVAQAPADPIGSVQDLSGQAFAVRVDGSRVQLSPGDLLFQGDVVETAAGGAINLLFVDRTTFSLGSDARLALDELVYNPATEAGTSSFSILKGVFVFVSGTIAQTDSTQMTVTTPVATIGIRGTKVAGEVRPAGEDSRFTVIEGTISVRTGAGEVTMGTANETTTVTSFQAPPSTPIVLTREQVEVAYREVEEISGGLQPSGADTPAPSAGEGPQEAPAGSVSPIDVPRQADPLTDAGPEPFAPALALAAPTLSEFVTLPPPPPTSPAEVDDDEPEPILASPVDGTAEPPPFTGEVPLPVSLNAAGAQWFGLQNIGGLFGLRDATSPPPDGGGDHFDDALGIRVGGQAYAASPETLIQNGNRFFANAQNLDSLNVAVDITFDGSLPVVRQILTLSNPTAEPVSTTVTWINNTGADSNHTVLSTSSGDLTADTADRHIVTAQVIGNDVSEVNAWIMYGPGSPAVTTSGVSLFENEPNFGFAGSEGLTATYNVAVGAGDTAHLMYFIGISGTAAGGNDLAAVFDNTAGAGFSGLVSDLSEAQLAATLNWDFGPIAGFDETTEVAGTFSFGNSPGLLQIEGDLAFAGSTVALFELGGLAPGDHDGFDRLEVGGTLALAGTIDVSAYGDFTAAAGDSFEIVEAGRLEGSVDRFDGLDVGGGVLLDATQSETTITLHGRAVTHQGTDLADTLVGTAGEDVFVGGDGDDLILMAGGRDIADGGAGDDVFVAADTGFGRLDGGDGYDVLVFADGERFDLTTLRGDQISRIEGIELNGGAQVLRLDGAIAHAATFGVNARTGAENSLVIDGKPGDQLEAAGVWTEAGRADLDGDGYTIYRSTEASAEVYVKDDVAVAFA